MKKVIFFVLSSIFILILNSDSVFALEQIPWSSYIGGYQYSDGFKTTNQNYTGYTSGSNPSFNVNVTVTTLYNTSGQSFTKYPYVVIYFKSGADSISVSRSATCNQSCFGSNFTLKRIGTTTWYGYPSYQWALVLPVAKYFSYDWSGSWESIPDEVSDTLTFSTTFTNTIPYEFTGIYLADNDSISNNTFENMQQFISNATTNSQNIINNQNTNTQNIINNQNQNANQAHQDSQDIKNAITSDEIPDNNNTQASEWASASASDSVVSDMVLMPITLLNAFSSGFNGSCQAYNLGSLYGTNLTLPCINISNYLGATLWGIIDVLMSGFLIYGIGKKFVKVFNDFTNLKDSQVDELYGGGNE